MCSSCGRLEALAWWTGKQDPTLSTLEKLAKALKVDVAKLLK
jgi:transcriptional regulator with XRE-family HTH domain